MNENEDRRTHQNDAVGKEFQTGSAVGTGHLPISGANEEGAAYSAKESRDNSQNRAFNFIRRLTVSEWLTFFVGFASLVVSYLTYKNAADTSDLKEAVANISTLATETKREADALNGQITQVKRQADSLAAQVDQMKRQADAAERMAKSAQDQLREIRSQTQAISAQTTAIKSSALAAIASAQAQERAAKIAALAHKPAVGLAGIDIGGLDSAPSADGTVHFTFQIRFHNIGGVAISGPIIFAFVSMAPSLPAKPDFSASPLVTGGNDLSVVPSAEFGQSKVVTLAIEKRIAAQVIAGKNHLFVYGWLTYSDGEGTSHKFCFAYDVAMTGGSGGVAYPAGGPAYHCET